MPEPKIAENSMARMTAYLGGRSVLKRTVTSRLDLVPMLRTGLPFGVLAAVGARLALSVDAVGASLHVPQRTLARRKEQGRLDTQESERAVRLADVASWATEIFGDVGARRWLQEPNRALGGATPMDLLDTDIGANAVRDVLVRIDYGVFS